MSTAKISSEVNWIYTVCGMDREHSPVSHSYKTLDEAVSKARAMKLNDWKDVMLSAPGNRKYSADEDPLKTVLGSAAQ